MYRHWIINDKGIEKSYIGRTTMPVAKRWGVDGKGYNNHNSHFYHAIQKYGWNNFTHDILLTIECDTVEELEFWLNTWEQYYIEKYDSYYNGYNSTLGGNVIFTKDMRYKLGHGSRGKPKSEEHKKKIGQARKGKKQSIETRKKLSETRKQKGLAKGEKNYFYDKHFNGSLNGNAKQVICLNTGKVFATKNDAVAWTGQKIDSGVSKCCHGKQEYAGKHPITGEPLRWKFYKDYLEEKDDNENENKQ